MGFWRNLTSSKTTAEFLDRQFGVGNVVSRQDQPIDTDALKAEMIRDDPEYAKLHALNEAADKQLAAIQQAELDYKDDLDALIKFWEDLIATDAKLPNGVSWPFRIVELYYKAKRYDDAWRVLNSLVLDPHLNKKARQWQIRILKKEKKDYAHIQRLLDNNQ